MKKVLLFLTVLIFLVGCSNKHDDQKLLNELLETIEIPEEISSNIELPNSYTHNGYTIKAKWESSDTDFLDNNGVIKQDIDDTYVSLFLELTLNKSSVTKTFDIIISAKDNEKVAEEILSTISIPSEINESISLPLFAIYNEIKYKIVWNSSDKDVIDSNGKISYYSTKKDVVLSATITYQREKYTKEFNVVVNEFDTKEMEDYLNNLNIPSTLNSNLTLDTKYEYNNHKYSLKWESSDISLLSNSGEIGLIYEITNVTLTVTMEIDHVNLSKVFNITLEKSSNDQLLNTIIDKINIQKHITNNINLPLKIDDVIECRWNSSNQDVISNEGIIASNISSPATVILTATFTIGDEIMTKEFETVVSQINHLYKTNKFEGQFENTHLNNIGNIVLNDDATEGTFVSNEIDHLGFSEVIATWDALTSENATCELLISLKVNNIFSDYISYGEWGLGLKNKSYSQSNSLIMLSYDEVIVLNNKNAEGFKYKFILRRNNKDIKSPEVFLIALAFNIKNYDYKFDKSLVNNGIKHNVPKLYQHDVPNIGNSICSITSSTMLLKYKGHDFSSINSLEHEYIAGLFKDYGNDIFGNWVYNCVGMASFGEVSYVKRFVDEYEFFYNLQEVGPMAASIAGNVKYTTISNNSSDSYNTNGHLIVVTGFEINNSETYVYINDPNVYGVAVKMKLNDFLNVWKNIAYIIE